MNNQLQFQMIRLPSDITDCGGLNSNSLQRVRELLRTAVEQVGTAVLMVDLSNVHCCGAEFVGILAEARCRLRNAGRALALLNVSENVWAVLEACGLGRPAADDRSAAGNSSRERRNRLNAMLRHQSATAAHVAPTPAGIRRIDRFPHGAMAQTV